VAVPTNGSATALPYGSFSSPSLPGSKGADVMANSISLHFVLTVWILII
jgi:hypothetical protein